MAFILTFLIALSLGGHGQPLRPPEWLVTKPFEVQGSDVPGSLHDLERAVSAWIDENKELETRLHITPAGDAVFAVAEEDGFYWCTVWRRGADGEWSTLRLDEFQERPLLDHSSSRFLIGSRNSIVDLSMSPPQSVPVPDGLWHISISHSLHWVGARGNLLVGGRYADGEFVEAFASPKPDTWNEGRDQAYEAIWLYDGEVAYLRGRAVVDIAAKRVHAVEGDLYPTVAAMHPGHDRVICWEAKMCRISRGGKIEPAAVDWTVRAGDRIWASSPSGTFVGGRAWSIAEMLPGGVGPHVIRVNQTVAPDETAPSLGGKQFLGWLVSESR